MVKRVFGFLKVRYEGLAKNSNLAFVLFALSDLYMVRQGLVGAGRGVVYPKTGKRPLKNEK